MSKQVLSDPREDAAVKASKADVARLEGQITLAEVEIRQLLAEQRAATDAVADAEQSMADNKGGTLPDIIAAKTKLAAVRQRLTAQQNDASPLYEQYSTAIAALAEAETKAKSAAWPAHFRSYLEATDRLEEELVAAVAAEQAVQAAHASLTAMFGGAFNWIDYAPGERVGNSQYGRRRLSVEWLADWKAHRLAVGVVDERTRLNHQRDLLIAKADKLEADAVRSGALQAEADKTRRANTWFHSRSFDPMVKVSMKGPQTDIRRPSSKPEPGNSA